MPVREVNRVRDAFEKHVGIKLGRSLYQGDGEVFAIKGDPNRLVKIVWTNDDEYANKRLKLLQYLRRTKNESVVKLYKVGAYTEDRIHPLSGLPVPEHFYYYIMDKLKLGAKNREVRMIERALGGDYLPPDAPGRVKAFVTKARKLKYYYDDFHKWNILKSKRGALKFIDLESFSV